MTRKNDAETIECSCFFKLKRKNQKTEFKLDMHNMSLLIISFNGGLFFRF